MKLSMAGCLFLAFWFSTVPIVSAQEPPTAKNDYPVYSLVFKPGSLITRIAAAGYFSPPILCADGAAYFGVPEAPTFQEQTIYSLNSSVQRVFSYHELPGLYDAHFRSFFPDESGAFLLVNAGQDSETQRDTTMSRQVQAISPHSHVAGERHDFLLKFDVAGHFERSIQLPDELRFYRFGELEDGSFVATAVDRATGAVKLPLLTPDGKIVRDLLPPGFATSSDLRKGEAGAGAALAFARAQSKLAGWFFAPVRHKILLYATNADVPVLEIGPDGATREVPITLLEGFSLDGFISSDDMWLVRYARKMVAEPGKPVVRRSAAGDYLLYEVDFNDGSLRRQLSFASVPDFGIACERGGVLTGYSVRRDSKYISFAASIPR